jgi:DNA-binding CsgD family transcriptional regulator
MSFPQDFLNRIAQERQLTDKEKEVFDLLCGRDMTPEAIAQTLHADKSTVSTRLSGIYKKFQISDPGPVKSSRLKDYLTSRYTTEKSQFFQPGAIASSTSSSSEHQLIENLRSHQSEKIKHLYGKIRLLTDDLIDVDRLYVDVYTWKRLSSSLASIRRIKLDEPASGVQVAKDHPWLMIFGKPGAGKSMFLRHLALACCKGKFQGDRIPVFIELRFIKDFCQFDLVKLICQELKKADLSQVERILDDGSLLLLLDGLDEVPELFRKTVLDNVHNICHEYFKNQIILTCRTQSIKYLPDGFECVEVVDFNREQVKLFSRNWFMASAKAPKNGAAQAKNFIEKLQQSENKQIEKLAITPVLLSLACWVFQDQGDFPQKRTNLYRQGVDLLLKDWDSRRNIQRKFSSPTYQSLSPEAKQNLLREIAIRKFRQKQFVLFKQQQIQNDIARYLNISSEEALDVLESIEEHHGLLVRQSSEIYAFSHLTFQEYFAACKTCFKQEWQTLVAHITDKHWEPICLMAVEMMNNPDEFLWSMKRKVDELVAADDKLQSLIEWAKSKANDAKSSGVAYRNVAIRAFYLSFHTWNFVDILYFLDSSLSSDFAWFSGEYSIDPDVKSEYWESMVAAHEAEQNALYEAYDLGYFPEPESNTVPESSGNVISVTDYLDDFIALDFRIQDTLDNLLSTAINQSSEYFMCSYYEQHFDYLTERPHSQALTDHLQDLVTLMTNPHESKFLSRYKQEFEQWWKANSQAWMEKLRDVLIDYRNIGYDWQFTEGQETLLQQYYDANKLLVDCLKQAQSKVSPAVRLAIEDSLLLPVRSDD